MWAHEYEAETVASPAAVWEVLSDLDHWDRWDTSMEWVRLDGPLAVGSEVRMKPIEQHDVITSVVVAVEPGRRYADRTVFEGVVLDFSHILHPTPNGGTRVVHRLEISGAGSAEIAPELGAAITADFPDAMAGLLTGAAR